MNEKLIEYIQRIKGEVSNIPDQRQRKLRKISAVVEKDVKSNRRAQLIFICTHNSRRSHLCQIWTATLARYFNLQSIEAHSGGTEVTAFNHRAVKSLKRAGFKIENSGVENPKYKVFYAQDKDPLICFSKTFDDESNPQGDFSAIMTCSDADANCPFIPGASSRISLSYKDPKEADGTPQEAKVYDERCRHIAVEMYYMLSQLI